MKISMYCSVRKIFYQILTAISKVNSDKQNECERECEVSKRQQTVPILNKNCLINIKDNHKLA